MTVDDFRAIALSMPEAVESAHMGHPDFRAGGKIFATLAYPDKHWGMVKLTPEEQQVYLATRPAAFVPAKGAWGLRGCTMVRLSAANEAAVHEAIESAWRTVRTRKSAAKRGGATKQRAR